MVINLYYMRNYLFLLLIALLQISCKNNSDKDCACKTTIDIYEGAEGPAKTIEKIVDKDLYLFRKDIIPYPEKYALDDAWFKYHTWYKPGEVKLRLNSDHTFLFNRTLSGKWKIQKYGVLFYTGSACNCDTSYFPGIADFTYVLNTGQYSLYHRYYAGKDNDTAAFDCRFNFSTDSLYQDPLANKKD